MRKGDRSAPEPWAVRETEVDLTQLGKAESIFALSNGHIGWMHVRSRGGHAIAGVAILAGSGEGGNRIQVGRGGGSERPLRGRYEASARSNLFRAIEELRRAA